MNETWIHGAPPVPPTLLIEEAIPLLLWGGRPRLEKVSGYRFRAIAQKSKIGRNAPCPCGSGKKYKRCCGYPAPAGSAESRS